MGEGKHGTGRSHRNAGGVASVTTIGGGMAFTWPTVTVVALECL